MILLRGAQIPPSCVDSPKLLIGGLGRPLRRHILGRCEVLDVVKCFGVTRNTRGFVRGEVVLEIVGAIDANTSIRHRRRLVQQIENESSRLDELGMQLYRQAETGRLMISYRPTGDVYVSLPKP